MTRRVRGEVAHGLGEPRADRGVVSAGAGKGLGGELLAKLCRGRAAILLHLIEHAQVIGRIDDDGDARMVLGAGADQRRAADVDVLDASGEIRAARRRALERIEIDGEKIDLGDGVIFERLLVAVLAAHREQPAMDFRMQRLHPPIHHFGALRDLGDVGHLEACLAQRLGGAAGGDELHALRREATRKIDEPRLVADRKERAGNLLHGRMSREQS